LIVGGLFYFGTPRGKYLEKQAMLSYLKKKYHKDFELNLEYDIENGNRATAFPSLV
jgi:hypothetical protein